MYPIGCQQAIFRSGPPHQHVAEIIRLVGILAVLFCFPETLRAEWPNVELRLDAGRTAHSVRPDHEGDALYWGDVPWEAWIGSETDGHWSFATGFDPDLGFALADRTSGQSFSLNGGAFFNSVPDSGDNEVDDIRELREMQDPLIRSDADDDDDDALERANDRFPFDYYHGVRPKITIVSGSGMTGLPNRLYPKALILKLTDDAGHVLHVAPVSVKAGPGGGLVAQHPEWKWGRPSLRLFTDDKGEVTFYLIAPNASGDQYFVARAGTLTVRIPVNVSYHLGSSPVTDLTTERIGAGTRLSWSPPATLPGSYEIERSVDQKNWKVIASGLPGNTTSYEDRYVSVSPVVYYRITALP